MAPPDLELLAVTEPQIPMAQYRVTFRCKQRPAAAGYRGSAWRGVFGRALRNLVCIARDKQCPECMLYRTCVYPYVFETPVEESEAVLGRTQFGPHPFVLVMEAGMADGDRYKERIGLTLFGRGNQYFPYLVQALREAALRGLRPNPEPLEMTDVEQAAEAEPGDGAAKWQRIYEPPGKLRPLPAVIRRWPKAPERVRLRLATPLRLRRREDLVTGENFRFSDLLSNLLRRVSLLMSYHAGRRLAVDFAGLAAAGRKVEWTAKDVGWKEWTRYSARQGTTMQMGGMVGWVEYEAAAWPELWPYVWVGQWTHAGKGTSMGLGRYVVEAV